MTNKINPNSTFHHEEDAKDFERLKDQFSNNPTPNADKAKSTDKDDFKNNKSR